MACFAESGFKGTTTRELAARIGITEAALYHYFPSKEALYGAIIDSKIGDPPLAQAIPEKGDDRAILGGLARAILERGAADPQFLRILTFTALEGHALAEPFFAARVRSLRQGLARYVERRIAEGAFRRVDPLLAARAFLGMVFDHLNARVVFQQDDDRRGADRRGGRDVRLDLPGRDPPRGERRCPVLASGSPGCARSTAARRWPAPASPPRWSSPR